MSHVDDLSSCSANILINSAVEKKTTEKRRHNNEDENEISPNKKTKVTKSTLNDISIEELTSHILIRKIGTSKSCTIHQVATYPGQEYIPLTVSKEPPAKKYPFALNHFQKESILCIDNNQSILVSAHKSLGKSALAEYSIARSLKLKQKIICTTPIETLTHQRYLEFKKEFKDVQLLTDDVTINPSASCLIMTTEILRKILYRGSEVIRQVGWVVFDEIHYMTDKERGVCEENLVLFPDNIRYVFIGHN